MIITITVVAGFASVVYFRGDLSGSHQAGARSLPGVTNDHGAPDLAGSAPLPKGIDPRNAGSLEECLGTITEKYNLASFTLATADGLLIGSTKRGAEDEAARYSYLYTQGTLQDETGAELLGIPHHGETVIGIARPSEPLSPELASALEQDTRDVLQHWV